MPTCHFLRTVRLSLIASAVLLLALARGVEAQEARPPAAVEAWVGSAKGWGEDQDGRHAQAGAGLRFYLSPRVSLSPRVRYARRFQTPDGGDEHTERVLETALAFEFRRPPNRRPRLISPFLLVSGGVRARRYPETRVSSGGQVYHYPEIRSTRPDWGVMVGARLFLPFASGRLYVAPEVGYAALTIVPATVALGIPIQRQDNRAR
jgi:hypothetical protein